MSELNSITINNGFPKDFDPSTLRVGNILEIKWTEGENENENVVVVQIKPSIDLQHLLVLTVDGLVIEIGANQIVKRLSSNIMRDWQVSR